MPQPLAVWIFGPIGSGKSTTLRKARLKGFRRVDQDAALEAALRREGLSLAVAGYTDEERARFTAIRQATAAAAWREVPGWRRRGESIAYETIGHRPHLFGGEVAADRAAGYAILACALRPPLPVCLARNRARERVLPERLVEETWHTVEELWRTGFYQALFEGASLKICTQPEEAAAQVDCWVKSHSR